MEVLSLNLIPTGTTPVVHVKQYDVGRTWRFELKEGPIVYTLDGSETIECDIKKKDGNVVTVAVTNTSASYIDIETTLQMTACSGDNLGAIRLTKGSDDIGTLNFILACERSPLENGIESESSIHNLESMVDVMVAEEVAEQYDSTNVIFDNEPTENHGIGYTVTSEGIKTAIDNAFDYDNTASGSLVHFTDGADNIPVKSLVSEIVATGGGGTPDAPIAINGFDSGIITRCGKNIIEGIDNNILALSSNNTVIYTSGTGTIIKAHLVAGQSYVISGVTKNRGIIAYFDNMPQISNTTSKYQSFGNATYTFTATYSGFALIYIANSIIDITTAQLELGDTATTYEAYKGNTYVFDFGQTVYGGHFDNEGNLIITHASIDLSTITTGGTAGSGYVWYTTLSNPKTVPNTEIAPIISEKYNAIRFNGVSSTVNTIAIRDNGVLYVNNGSDTTRPSGIAVYELANPITLSITSQDIPTLLGENNFYSNCGDLEVNYYTYKSNDILEFVDSEIGKKNGTNIPIEENSQDSIKDYVDNGLSGKADTSNTYTKSEVDTLLSGKASTNLINSYQSNLDSPAVIEGVGGYASIMVLGFVQGVGAIAVLIKIDNATISSQIDMSTGSAFSKPQVTFTYSSNALTITTTNANNSTFTVIKGGI